MTVSATFVLRPHAATRISNGIKLDNVRNSALRPRRENANFTFDDSRRNFRCVLIQVVTVIQFGVSSITFEEKETSTFDSKHDDGRFVATSQVVAYRH
jgi:hypothetical protein